MAERLDFQLCGELQVRRDGADLPLHGTARKGRLALAYLVLNHDRVVTRDELMERLSTEPDPERVAASVSQTLSRLRRVLGQERLERLPAGAVRLRGPLQVDVEHAEETLRDGRHAIEAHEWSAASEASRAVLDELAGEVLAGDEADWLEDVRRTVADLRVEALELRATAALRMGNPAEALAAARAAVARSATRQPAWALVMEAQARQGDVTGATETFHAIRRKLMGESGLPLSRRLVDLHDRIVAGELSGNGHVKASVALPPALSFESGGEPFVGRRAILDRLRGRYAQAKAGARQFVVLAGEPGIGKTRLASEFAREAHADGAVVLYGRSDVETLVPYQPFVSAIGHYVGECGDGLADELGAELSELSRLIPSLARQLPQLREPLAVEPEMRRFRLFNAVAGVLAYVARERPALLILDDLQWADPSTTLLLRHTVQEIHDVRLLVLGTHREAEGCESDQLADLLARPRPGFERIAVSGLDAEETAALVAARARGAASGDAVGALLEATGGNPLLLEETLKSLGAGEPVSARAVRDVGLSEGAKQLISGRLKRLGPAAHRVLADASVVGARFGVRVLEAVSGEQVIEALEAAEAAGLVRELPGGGDRYTFAHALVRDTLLDGQSAARRRRLHHRIGEALEAGGEAVHPAELARHFTESGDAPKALEYSLEAGRQAADALAYEDAAEHFERALRLLEDERPRCEVLLELGRVQLRQGSPAARATFRDAFALAERDRWPDLLGQAALGFASRYTEAGVVDNDGIALLRTARDAAADGPAALRAELTARLADSLHFAPEPAEAERLSAEALQLALDEGDPHALSAAFESRHAALMSIHHLDDRLWLSRQLVDLAQLERERELEALGRHWRIYDLLEAAEMEAAQGEREALAALAGELRQPLYHHFSVGWDVVWAQLAGRVDEVEALARRFYDLGVAAQARDTETIYHAQLIALRRRQERWPDFISTVQDAVAAHPTLRIWRAVLPLTYLASGDAPAAEADFEWFAADGFSRVRRDMFWFATLSVLAETCTLLRDAPRAQVLYDLLDPFKERNVQVTQAVCWGSVERFLGLLAAVLGRGEAAVAHLQSAIARNEAGGNPAAAALVRRDLAKLLAK